MIRFFIEEIDGDPVIRLSDAQAAELSAGVGDVLIIDSQVIKVERSKAETERQIAIGSELMTQYREVLEALAKT